MADSGLAEAAALLPGSQQPIEQAWIDARKKSNLNEGEFVNRLILSGSAYLRQHADNPIDWYSWSDANLAKAKAENKLIFLSIGYASCHWCHVMEDESFSQADVAFVLNSSFVSLKVDREEKPDIDAYFNFVVETIKAESGWPITVILLPDGKPVFAANYLSKEKLITVLERMAQLWEKQPQSVIANAKLIDKELVRRSQALTNTAATGDTNLLDLASQNLLGSIDSVHSGFGAANKFPSELKLQFLLNTYKSSPSDALKLTLMDQLNAFMYSGLNDVVFGGVFRYTTDRQMHRPHFEKMLYNQALTVILFTDAARWLEIPEYRRYADTVIAFVESTMQLPAGLYAAAIDAGHKGQEGGYYLWQPAEVSMLPSRLQRIHFNEKWVFIHGAMVASETRAWQESLILSRTDSPRVISNKITAWNALWLSALVSANKIDTATHLAEAVWKQAWSAGELFRIGTQLGYLDDYSYLAKAYWQLYKNSGDLIWKKRANQLEDTMLTKFYRENTLYYSSYTEKILLPQNLFQDTELPAPGAVAIELLGLQQTEVRYYQAYNRLKQAAFSGVGTQPEYFLSLLQATQLHYPEENKIFANGHGLAALTPAPGASEWHLQISLEDGWYINAASVFDDKLIPTRVINNPKIAKIHYPAGEKTTTEFSSQALNLYNGPVLIKLSTPSQPERLKLTVELQACKKTLCLLPERFELIAGSSAQ